MEHLFQLELVFSVRLRRQQDSIRCILRAKLKGIVEAMPFFYRRIEKMFADYNLVIYVSIMCVALVFLL